MKTRLALLLLLGGHAATAAVPVPAPMTYTQNFNTLPSATAANWADNVTIVGWWLHRDGTAPPNPASINVSNGNTTTWLANLYSLGATGNTERALGSAPTTAHGTYSHIVIFQNTSANPLKVSNVKYDVEVYRTNTTTGLTETTQFSRRIAATQAEITSALATGWTADTTLDYVYPGQATGGATRPPDVATVNRAPGTDIVVPAGQHLALRWSNANDGGSDAYMGIDNVEIQFGVPTCSLTATAGGVTRDQNGTPGNPDDDTFSFNVTVTGFQTGASNGWRSTTGPNVTGNYGVATAVTSVPIASSPLNFTMVDSLNAACGTSVNVTAPQLDLFLTVDENLVLSFTAAPLGAQSHVRTGLSKEPGFSGGTATARVQFQPAPNNTAKYFDINNAKPLFVTEAVNISNVTEFVAGLELAAYTTSDTGFEADDGLTVSVQTASAPTGPWTNVTPPVLSVPNGITLFDQIKVSNPGIGYGAASFPAADFPFVRFRSGAIPRGAATYARLSTTGGNNSASEHLLFDNVTFASPRCAILVTPTITRDNQVDDVLENDIFAVSAVIRAELNQGSTGWLSNANPASGTYGSTPVTFGPYPVSAGPQTITFTDNADPNCTLTVTFTPPPTVLRTDIINMARNERNTVTLNDDTVSFRLTMSAQNGATGWRSNIPIPGAPGTFYSGNYLDFYDIVAEVASLPDVPLIIDKADASATISVATSIPNPAYYVVGDFLRVGVPPALVPSVEYPPDLTGFTVPNAWNNQANGVLTLNDSSDPDILSRSVVAILFIEEGGPVIGKVNFTADLVVSETSPTSNFETDDTFKAILEWEVQGLNDWQNLIDLHDLDGNEMLNGYTDTAAAPYNNNRLLDEFNRPAPGLQVSGMVSRTIQLTGSIPADATIAVFTIEGDNDSGESYRLENVHFIEEGANPTADGDGDGVTDSDEDIMGTDKHDSESVLRLESTPENPTQFTFTGIGGRFYRVYFSDDTAQGTHLRKWVDAGLGTMQDFGPHTVDVTEVSGVPRRFVRVHVMQADGPWPPVME